ncbi:hypothetical protein [Negadavirga shengliensis]|uniref:Glycosyltransferase family 1 protein n=1 Tax=Negadavirga shengliensis TaxID=1389218 RepID=A0ABV9SX81_9BACT
MIPVAADTHVYIICPAQFATGGPEALHQLGHHLRKKGIKAFMYYIWMNDRKKKRKITTQDPVHSRYRGYSVPYTDSIENHSRHYLITPETYLDPIFDKNVEKVGKIVWWLSVSNYYKILLPKIKKYHRNPLFWIRKLVNPKKLGTLEELKTAGVLHLAHSYYSKVHLEQHGLTIAGRISDYMNKVFFEKADDTFPKKNQVIYNPVKNDFFLQKIIQASPGINWVPISGLSPEQVVQIMNESKVYVDFGYHPGKERMPREACIMRCCLIIGKEGSASFQQDMPIPDAYRFEKKEESIPAIADQITACLANYEYHIPHFSHYRQVLLEEEVAFAQDVNTVFVQMKEQSIQKPVLS